VTWEEKFAAIQALAREASLKMRKPGDWYVEAVGVEISEGCLLVGSYGNGRTPQEAVEDHWIKWTQLTGKQTHLVKNAMRDDRQTYRWNGYMWAEVHEPKVGAGVPRGAA
jgi:hypothetical protein